MFLYETHMHTYPSSDCASASPAEQVRAYKDRGYAGIIVTDHFINGNTGCPPGLSWAKTIRFFAKGYELAKKEGDRIGLDVFFGFEFNIGGLEFLTYGLFPDLLLEHPGMDNLTVSQYSDLVRSSGGYLAQAHPYRAESWMKNAGPVDPGLIDGVEVYNASIFDISTNPKALEFARLHGLPMQAGSDSHHKKLRFASGIGLFTKAESIFDIIRAIKAGKATLIVPPSF